MSPRTPPFKVLVVDDDAAMLILCRRFLEGACDVFTARGFEAAVGVLEAEPAIGLVISDYNMPPGSSGVALLELVRDRWPLMRRVLMSGEAIVGIEDAIASGRIDQFLVKPVGMEELIRLVEQFG